MGIKPPVDIRVFHGKNTVLPKMKINKDVHIGYTKSPKPVLRWKTQVALGDGVAINEKELYYRVPSDVTFLQPHIFVVTDSEMHKLDVFDLSRGADPYCGSIGTGKMWPNCVSTYHGDGGKILITDRSEQNVKIFDVEKGKVVTSWANKTSGWYPHGIAMSSKKEIIVTDCENQRVEVFSETGKLQKSFGEEGTRLEEFCLPLFCTFDAKDRIIVADNMNSTIKIFATNGNQLGFMGDGNHDNPRRTLLCPFGVCLNIDGLMLVCDYEKNNILEYDMDSNAHTAADLYIPELKRDVMNSKMGCNSPCGVAVGPCGTLVFTEYSRNHAAIKAYSLGNIGTRL
jgi:tripartite motif-containing protein 71